MPSRIIIGLRLYKMSPSVREITVELAPTGILIPSHTGGDRDFWGRASIQMVARLFVRNNNQLWARLWMKAVEPGGDRTTAEGSAEYRVYSGGNASPRVDLIYEILSDQYTYVQYVDQTWEEDVLSTGDSGELVKEFRAVGDTYGEEAGSRTQVQARFNPVTIKALVRDN